MEYFSFNCNVPEISQTLKYTYTVSAWKDVSHETSDLPFPIKDENL